MAVSISSAQHYLECGQCEEYPAKFFCKTCHGNLCKNCKTEHKNRQITKNHEIFQLKKYKKEPIGQLNCADHYSKKLECFCCPCKKPVCTECIVWSHNGHAVQPLSTAYIEIRDQLQKKKEEIENKLLPKYRELLEGEFLKKAVLSQQANEEQKQIETHTQNLMEIVKEFGQKTVQDLRVIEEQGHREIDQSSTELQRKIHQLQRASQVLSESIDAEPGSFFSKSINCNMMEDFQPFPTLHNYHLHKFQPGPTSQMISNNFGRLPFLEKTGTGFDFGKTPSLTAFGGTPSGFTFGATTKQASSGTEGFSFGVPSNVQHNSLFGNSRTSSQTTGFGGTPSGFSFGSTTKKASSGTEGFSFGVPSNVQHNSLFGNSRTSSQTTGFGGTPSGFSFGSTTKKASSVTEGFSFGVPSNVQHNSLFGNSRTSSQTTGFGGTPSGFSFGSTTKQASSGTEGFSFGRSSNLQHNSLFGN